MTDVAHLRHLLRFKESNRSEYEALVDGIEFALAELGIDDQEMPATLPEAKQLYNELIPRLKPPTPSQLRELDRLLSETGGTLNGALVSEAATQLLIDYLRYVKLEELSNERDLFEEDFEITLDKTYSDEIDPVDRARTSLEMLRSMLLPLLIGLIVGWIPGIGSWIFSIGFFLTLLGIGFGILAGWDWDIRYLTWVGYVTLGSLVGVMALA